MMTPVSSPYLVPFDGSFSVAAAPTAPPKQAPDGKEAKKRLEDLVEALADLQHQMYADDRFAMLLVFQAMDAAGKDSTVRHVLSGVNPAGCQVYSFKQPSREELDHDFLWRTSRSLPERGRIGVHNRSHYEEVLAVRVHPEYLGGQKLPEVPDDLEALWQQRFESIRSLEAHLARTGTVVLKFWLNVSREEQARRFVSRIDDPRKNWKFSGGDLEERKRWPDYMAAYEAALNATSRAEAPWYAIPADDKGHMRYAVADIVVRTLQGLGLRWPELADRERQRLPEYRAALEGGA